MARNITLTLGAGLGADLGPNFNLTANVGSVTPSTATKTELTAGKGVSVDDAATEVTITSTGTCTNAITQTIPCAGETTTSTTTTTLGPCDCYYYDVEITQTDIDNATGNSDISKNGVVFVSYRRCDDTGFDTITYSVASYYGNAFCMNSNPMYSPVIDVWQDDMQISYTSTATNTNNCCATTTTTAAPTTTTTTSGVTYDNYHADQYDCATCTLQSVDTVIAFPTGTSVTVDKWYAPESLNGYVYRLTSLTPQTGPGLIMLTSEFNSCAFACFV